VTRFILAKMVASNKAFYGSSGPLNDFADSERV
jgi:hypothetical protein